MAYQDDAIISFARLELTCEVAHVFGDKMYWTDAGTNKIQRANLDGTGVVDTNVVDLVTTGLVTPLGIALDRAERKMYWVDGNSADPLQTIELADMIVNPVVGPPAVTGPPPQRPGTHRAGSGQQPSKDILDGLLRQEDQAGQPGRHRRGAPGQHAVLPS